MISATDGRTCDAPASSLFPRMANASMTAEASPLLATRAASRRSRSRTTATSAWESSGLQALKQCLHLRSPLLTLCLLPLPSLSHGKCLVSKGLLFLHSNVRSLLPKIPEVRLLLSRTKAAVFAASETWLDATVNDGEVRIPGYNVSRLDRNRNGGGVAQYV